MNMAVITRTGASLVVALCGGLAPAGAIGDAPDVCDVFAAEAPKAQSAFGAFNELLGRVARDPTSAQQEQLKTLQADLVHELQQEADVIEAAQAPPEFDDVVSDYTNAERALAQTYVQLDVDAISPAVATSDKAQSAFLARCNAAI